MTSDKSPETSAQNAKNSKETWVIASDGSSMILGKVIVFEGKSIAHATLLDLSPAYDYFGMYQPTKEGLVGQTLLAYPTAGLFDDAPLTMRPTRVLVLSDAAKEMLAPVIEQAADVSQKSLSRFKEATKSTK